MNMSGSSPSVQVASAFRSTSCNLVCRAAILGTFAILPAMFAASATPPATVNNALNVQVTNTQAAPVQTQDVDNPAFQPFQFEANFGMGPTDISGGDTFTVPAGKRLVIEFVSFQSLLPAGQTPVFNVIQVNPPTVIREYPVRFFFLTSIQSSDSKLGLGPQAPTSLWVGTSPTRLYANPGTVVSMSVYRNVLGGSGNGSVSISGYYVNVP